MPTRAERVEALFHAALERTGDERARVLDRECAGDPELRREVEALLALDARPDARIDASAPEVLALGARGEPSLFVGRRFGPFRLLRCIAQGGMGAVYEASQESPARTVAVKVLRCTVASDDLERRFRVEAGFLARLQHPAIAHVYEAGVAEIDGARVPFIAMELVADARPITEHARETGLDLRARVALFAEVCDAVHHGHQRGVIHRDLKPANVLVGRDGRPKLIDFGVARAVDPEDATRRTEAGVLLGTVHYMSPEQCAGARDVDVRSDVYSLGVVLYELVCGRLPYDFEGVPLPLAARIVHETAPRRPSEALRAARGDLETILLKALEKDPERRYASASELAADLRRFLAGEPVLARPPSLGYRASIVLRRHRVLAGALAVVFLVAVAAAIVSARFAWREQRARVAQERSSYVANVAAADLSLRTYDAASARRRLESVPEPMRGWEWSHLWGRLDPSLRRIDGPLARCEAVAWFAGRIASAWYYPDGVRILLCDAHTGAEIASHDPSPSVPTAIAIANDDTVVWGGFDGRLRRWDPSGRAPERVVDAHSERVTAMCVTRERNALSVSLDGTLRLWPAGEDASRLVHEEPGIGFHDLALAIEEDRVAIACDDGSVRVVRLSGRPIAGVYRAHERAARAVALHPTSPLIATGGADGTVRIFQAETGRQLEELTGHESEVRDLAFLDRGALLASVSNDRTVRVWEVATFRLVNVLYGHEQWIKCLAPAPLGREFATGGYDRTLRVWDALAEVQGKRLADHQAFVRELAFSGDGRHLATASYDRTARIYDVATWQSVATLAGHEDRVTSVAFHPDGARVATASNDGSVRVWSVPAGELLATIEGPADGVHALASDPAGTLLASGSKEGRVTLHRWSDLEEVARLEHGAPLQQLAFDAGGARLATVTNDRRLSVWDVAAARELWRATSASSLHDVAFSPDGAQIATASGEFDATGVGIGLWDARTGELQAELEGHSDVVFAVAYSPDGSRLASAAADSTVRLWDPAARAELLVLRGHKSWVWTVAFSPDGRWLASGGGNEDGTDVGVRLWRGGDAPAEPAAEAPAR